MEKYIESTRTLQYLRYVKEVEYITKYEDIIYAKHFEYILSRKSGQARFLLPNLSPACAERKI